MALLEQPGPLVTTTMVIAETGYLLTRHLGPASEVVLYESIEAGDLTVENLTTADWARIRNSPRSTRPSHWEAPTPV